jgi:hypothetical protein
MGEDGGAGISFVTAAETDPIPSVQQMGRKPNICHPLMSLNY